MKDYINNNKNYLMKLFKKEQGKSDYENEFKKTDEMSVSLMNP